MIGCVVEFGAVQIKKIKLRIALCPGYGSDRSPPPLLLCSLTPDGTELQQRAASAVVSSCNANAEAGDPDRGREDGEKPEETLFREKS